MPTSQETFSRLKKLLEGFSAASGRMAVLSGAGISAESGIPTFRGPEGYWRVGSREYRPEEMATLAMFRRDPWEVWSWYLYRWTVCSRAEPNQGHAGVAVLEKALGDRFRLITQNVDGLHLRAGSSMERTFQIHGNLDFMRCGRPCGTDLHALPELVLPKKRNEPVREEEKSALVCPACGAIARPHVLWFDECYDEPLFRAESAIRWARDANLLLVVGTAGATTLPMQIGEIFFHRKETIFLDVNPDPNPFRRLAEAHPNGLTLAGTSGELIPAFLEAWEGVHKKQDP
jgi:NAD-dependent deacetylase